MVNDPKDIKIAIVYDNTAKEGFQADWGFSCLIETNNRRILFDAGANGSILLSNMEKLGIDPKTIDEVFISHAHWDHTGGLKDFLEQNSKVTLYVPASYEPPQAEKIARITGPKGLDKNIFSTGELSGIEQSLVIKTEKGLVIIAGCSHPGVGNILRAASRFGKPYALIGGLHGFSNFDLIKHLQLVCPTHCTQYITEIKDLYPNKYVEGGAGKIIEI